MLRLSMPSLNDLETVRDWGLMPSRIYNTITEQSKQGKVTQGIFPCCPWELDTILTL